MRLWNACSLFFIAVFPCSILHQFLLHEAKITPHNFISTYNFSISVLLVPFELHSYIHTYRHTKSQQQTVLILFVLWQNIWREKCESLCTVYKYLIYDSHCLLILRYKSCTYFGLEIYVNVAWCTHRVEESVVHRIIGIEFVQNNDLDKNTHVL